MISYLRSKILSFIFLIKAKSFGFGFYCGSNIFIKGIKYISIGNNFRVGNNFRMECWDKYQVDIFNPRIQIGNNITINNNVHIGAINSIEIKDFVLIGSNVLIIDHQHGFISELDLNIPPVYRRLSSKGKVLIEKNVWIGDNVVILPDVVIGECSVIGAGAVVTKSIPQYSVVAGNPSRIIKKLEK